MSTRRYDLGLKPVGEAVAKTATSTSKSAVSQKVVARTETALAELLGADLSGLDLVVRSLGRSEIDTRLSWSDDSLKPVRPVDAVLVEATGLVL